MARPFFCFTLDTEPDDLWAARPTLSFSHFERLFDFHQELTDRGARPTYLTTSEIAEDPPAARVMTQILKTGEAELGAHFHTWTREWPFYVPDLGAPPIHACVHQLDSNVEEAMLAYTCASLNKTFGVRPVSYRGGRWSLGTRSARALRDCGIKYDSTVTPGISWTDASHPLKSGPDFRHAPRQPYWLAEDVLEIPVGASFHPDRETALDQGFYSRLQRKVCRGLGLPAGVHWLRPTTMSRRQMQACLRQLREDDVPVWVAMIHSSEIGPNRYFPNEEAIAQFRRRCLELVDDALDLGAVGATLAEAGAEVIQAACGLTDSAKKAMSQAA